MRKLLFWSRSNWFYLLVPLWLAIGWALHSFFDWQMRSSEGEVLALLYWCIVIPALFVLCFRQMPPRALLLRVAALVCGGFWLASVTVPEEAHGILERWVWLRYLGLGLLAIIEGVAFIAVMRLLFGGEAKAEELEKQGIPPIVAKIMLAEARFWKWVWRKLTGK